MTPAPQNTSVVTLIARQPIVDLDRTVIGYELLYRRAPSDDHAAVRNGTIATAHVMSSVLASDLCALTGDRPSFVNFERDLLVSGFPTLLQPPAAFVLEVLETVPLDAEVLACCDALRSQGFRIALDDVDSPDRVDAFGPRADFVKINWADVPPAEHRAIIGAARRAQAAVIVERIETEAEFAAAREAGCDYVQGYLMGRPSPVQGKTLPPLDIRLLELVEALADPDTPVGRIEAMVTQDVALTYRVLRFANSARAAQQQDVTAIRSAIALMGRDDLRRFASLLLLSRMVVDCPSYLVEQALVRARFCEDLAHVRGETRRASTYFLAGMLSTIDALLGVPMGEAVRGLPLSREITTGLLGGQGPVRDMLDLVRAYEGGRWECVDAVGRRVGLSGSALVDTYAQAIASAEQTVAAAS